jgi:guanylate kinase
MNNKGILIVLSGFSGAGKGTLMKRLLEVHGEEYALSVSATTRSPREGETDGISYFFKTKEEFEKMIGQDAFLEYAGYCGNYYGTPKDYVDQKLAEGKNVILEIEIQGALKVKEKRPDTLLLFVTPPNAAELKNRLVGRGTESSEVIDQRLSRAFEEAEGVEQYDYLLINDDLDTCVEEIHEIIKSEQRRLIREHNRSRIADIRKDLKQFKKGD